MQHVCKYSLLTTLILSASTQAQEEFRQHEAHVHGHVEFNIAQDNNEILVEIIAPGADIVGFEHAPQNEQQHQLLEKVERTLRQADNIFILSSASGCKTEHVHITNTLESEASHDEHDHDHGEAHDEHDHDHGEVHDEHDHDHEEVHDEHDHDHGEVHDEHDHHGQFTIEYHFDCRDTSKLKNIETTWFNHFPNTEKISVNLLTDTAQKALELSKNNKIIKL